MARERCVRKTAQYGRLWHPGETRTITEFDANGDPVESAHFRMLQESEEVDPSKFHSQEELQAKRKELDSRDKSTAILNALQKLDSKDDSHWTEGGMPSLQQIHLLTDLDVKRADVMAAAPDFDRKAWAEVQEAKKSSS